jgi:hypothetical protein
MIKAGLRIIIGTNRSIIIDEIKRLAGEYQSNPDHPYSISPNDVCLCIEKEMEWGRGLSPVTHT